MLKIGRIVGFGSGVIALTLAYLLPNIIELSIYGTTITLISAPAIIGGFIWKRATAKAAMFSIIIGLVAAFSAIPFLKEKAVVPAIVTSIIAFVVVSVITKHSGAENVELMKA